RRETTVCRGKHHLASARYRRICRVLRSSLKVNKKTDGPISEPSVFMLANSRSPYLLIRSTWNCTKSSIGERMMRPTSIPYVFAFSSNTLRKLYPTDPMQLKVYDW